MADRSPRRFPQDRPTERYDRAYWLNRCHGFEVAAPGRRVGVVSEVRYASRADVPDLIVVRTGHLHQELLIPVDQVERIEAGSGRLELIDGAIASKRPHRRWSRRHPVKRIASSRAS